MRNSQEVLSELLSHLKISANKLSAEIGLNANTAIYHIKNGRNGISPDLANKIVGRYPEIRYNWLLTGEGPMKKGAAAQDPVANDEQEKYRPHDLNSVHLDLKKDIRELAKGMQENFKVVNDGMVRQLMKQQKILDFVESLNAKEIASATSDLKKLLEQKK